MFVVIVDFIIKPDHIHAFRDAVSAQARNSLAREPGCTVFDVCTDPADPARIFLYEIYDDEAAFNVHLGSEHFQSFDAATRTWVTEKTVRTLHRVEVQP